MAEAVGVLAAAAVALVGAAFATHRRQRLLLRTGWRPPTRATPALRLALGPVVGGAALFGALVGLRLAGIPGAVAAAVAAVAAPVAVRRRRAAKERVAMESQLADAVAAIASGLRSSLSLPQCIALASDEVPPPLGPTLRGVADRVTLGVPLDDSLGQWAASVPTADVRLAAGVLLLHRSTGGALPPVLDQLARTLRERRAAARELRSLTAQARLSGTILGFLPVGFFLFLSATSRQDMLTAYRSPAGAAAIAAGFGLQVAAFLWIRRLLRVEP